MFIVATKIALLSIDANKHDKYVYKTKHFVQKCTDLQNISVPLPRFLNNRNAFELFLHLIIYMGLLQEKLARYDLPQKYKAEGIYPYFREIQGKQGTVLNLSIHQFLIRL